MLNRVPESIRKSARLVTLKHPNKMNATVWRKKLNRTSTNQPPTIGGLPTIGGMGVLDGEDEADFTYEELGDAAVVFCGIYQGEGQNWNDDDDGLSYQSPPIESLIECVKETDDVDFFEAGKNDVVTVELGDQVLTYEVTAEIGSVLIPPYTKKYALSPRDENFEFNRG